LNRIFGGFLDVMVLFSLYLDVDVDVNVDVDVDVKANVNVESLFHFNRNVQNISMVSIGSKTHEA
jgi:hypothetical protein